MISYDFFLILLFVGISSSSSAPTVGDENETKKASLATAIVNTQILTILNYHETQVYIYSALSNENDNRERPQKWIFYYVPVMLPNQEEDGRWVRQTKNEVRLRLILGNDEVSELARSAIIKKYDLSVTRFAKYWDVAPLMIDSLMAYVVKGSNSPVEGVHPYRGVHPNTLSITFRFVCSNEESARLVVDQLIEGEYEIEVAFYFAGFRQVTTELLVITSDQLKTVSSKTTADGGNRKAQYLHRSQAATFVSKYSNNVKKIIYRESGGPSTDTTTRGLDDQFSSLLQQG